MELIIASSTTDNAVTVNVTGEVDVANADGLRDKINEAFTDGVTSVLVNLEKCSYIDSTGIGVLVGAATKASELDVKFSVVKPQPNVLRVFTLLGVDKQLNVVEA